VSGIPAVGLLVVLVACGGAENGDATACVGVRASAKAAAEAGVRLRAEGSTDSAAIERSARDYVGAVRSSPGCFTPAQRENAEDTGRILPSAS